VGLGRRGRGRAKRWPRSRGADERILRSSGPPNAEEHRLGAGAEVQSKKQRRPSKGPRTVFEDEERHTFKKTVAPERRARVRVGATRSNATLRRRLSGARKGRRRKKRDPHPRCTSRFRNRTTAFEVRWVETPRSKQAVTSMRRRPGLLLRCRLELQIASIRARGIHGWFRSFDFTTTYRATPGRA